MEIVNIGGRVGEDLYLEAKEAAALLGVSTGTLYAYVSRKGLRSFAIEGTRRRRYWRSDVMALLAGSDAQEPQQLVRTTALTLLTDAGLFYRGREVVTLAEANTLEQVATLLWDAPPDLFATTPSSKSEIKALATALRHLSPLDRALALMPVLEHDDAKSADLSEAGFLRTSAGALRWMAAIVAGGYTPSTEPVHLVLSRSAVPDGRYDDLVRRALVLAADHELDPTTYAVRAAANTGVTPFGAVAAGLIAGRGQRLRHSRALATTRFLRSMIASADPSREISHLYRAGEPIPGFAPAEVHAGRDPRPGALLMAMRTQLLGEPQFDKLDAMIATASDLTGGEPRFIVPMAYLSILLGMEDEPLGFSTPGRAVGWLAHAHEQYRTGTLVRPRAAYVGKLP